jgi:ferrochelatase
LSKPDCCEASHPAHKTCYRAQAFKTVAGLAQRHQLSSGKFSVSFQSRLGREPWLKPYTDLVLEQLPGRGIHKLLVICPAFVADCLETVEEIGLRGRETFLSAGGKNLTLIPCLNEHSAWLEALAKMIVKQIPN